jgi:endonuclease G
MKKIIISLLFVSSTVFASDCPTLYPNKQPIVVPNTVELCNSFYVSAFDKENSRVILVSEHLVYGTIGSAPRKDTFRADKRVGQRPSPIHYFKSGYDKGHMAPAGDASTDAEMYDTFLMTNMTPQVPSLNRESWRVLEENTRKLLDNSKSDMYVVNIAMYEDDKKINGIPVPSSYWKIVTVDGKTKYYYARNLPNAKVVERDATPISTLLPK